MAVSTSQHELTSKYSFIAVVLVASRQKPHGSIDAMLLTPGAQSLFSNYNSSALKESHKLINTHQPLVKTLVHELFQTLVVHIKTCY